VSRTQHGFTLIEILAVVTILAIAAVAAIPIINSGYADVKLTAAARSVMADLFYAQNYAITTQNPVYVVFATPAGTGGKYTLKQSNSGTVAPLIRPGGSTFVVNLGKLNGPLVGTQLVDATLGTVTVAGATLTDGTIGFDTLGQPFKSSPTPENLATGVTLVPLRSPDGTITMTLNIEAFTGEITVPQPAP
jgi:prepilin-type N-terminal cleavage/methylation domain-containing protein